MRERKMLHAQKEALRFAALVRALRTSPDDYRSFLVGCGCAKSGAVKRASMDLTRALAEMRKS